jgi:hypothetical protein
MIAFESKICESTRAQNFCVTSAFHNIDVLAYITFLLGNKNLLAFALVCRSCKDSVLLISNSKSLNLSTNIVGFTYRMEMLTWACDMKIPMTKCLFQYVVKNGSMAMIQFLRSQHPPCPWDSLACYYASEGRKLDVIQWLRLQTPRCPWDA